MPSKIVFSLLFTFLALKVWPLPASWTVSPVLDSEIPAILKELKACGLDGQIAHLHSPSNEEGTGPVFVPQTIENLTVCPKASWPILRDPRAIHILRQMSTYGVTLAFTPIRQVNEVYTSAFLSLDNNPYKVTLEETFAVGGRQFPLMTLTEGATFDTLTHEFQHLLDLSKVSRPLHKSLNEILPAKDVHIAADFVLELRARFKQVRAVRSEDEGNEYFWMLNDGRGGFLELPREDYRRQLRKAISETFVSLYGEPFEKLISTMKPAQADRVRRVMQPYLEREMFGAVGVSQYMNGFIFFMCSELL